MELTCAWLLEHRFRSGHAQSAKSGESPTTCPPCIASAPQKQCLSKWSQTTMREILKIPGNLFARRLYNQQTNHTRAENWRAKSNS